MTHSIKDLPDLVDRLTTAQKQVFERIYYLDAFNGELKLPKTMVPWVREQFGQTGHVASQKIIKITNRVTAESTVYNPLRALRPHNYSRPAVKKHAGNKDEGADLFASPLENTAEDLFERVEGEYCITAGNVAKYEQYHCVVVFKNADPWDFGCNEVADYIETGWRWAHRAHEFDPDAQNCLFLWNCTNRAGASIRHGHAQVILGRGMQYVKIEHLRQYALLYEKKYRSSYFADLFAIHEVLGLGWKAAGIRGMSYLTALKQNEVMILAPQLTMSLIKNIYRVLACYRDRLKVKSFNLSIAFPPLGDCEGWEDFPVIARMVDRGDPADTSSDIGAMELYGGNVITSDPYETVRAILKDR